MQPKENGYTVGGEAEKFRGEFKLWPGILTISFCLEILENYEHHPSWLLKDRGCRWHAVDTEHCEDSETVGSFHFTPLTITGKPIVLVMVSGHGCNFHRELFFIL